MRQRWASWSTRRRIVALSAALLLLIALLDLNFIREGGVPSKVVRGTSVSPGTQPARDWYFAVGASQGGVLMDIHLANPGPDPANAVMRYCPGGGWCDDRRVTVPPNRGMTVIGEADRARGFGRGYSGLSVHVRSDTPVVAERTLSWNIPDEGRVGFVTGPGLRRLSRDPTISAPGAESISTFDPRTGDRRDHAPGQPIRPGTEVAAEGIAWAGGVPAVIQPDLPVPATGWWFSAWGGKGQHDRLLVVATQRAEIEVLRVPRLELGGRDRVREPATAPVRISVGEGSNQFVDLGPEPAAVKVTASTPVMAWRVSSAERQFQRNYLDPGFA